MYPPSPFNNPLTGYAPPQRAAILPTVPPPQPFSQPPPMAAPLMPQYAQPPGMQGMHTGGIYKPQPVGATPQYGATQLPQMPAPMVNVPPLQGQTGFAPLQGQARGFAPRPPVQGGFAPLPQPTPFSPHATVLARALQGGQLNNPQRAY